MRADRRHERSREEETVQRRLNRETTSVTVSYAMGDDQVTRVGRGPSMAARVEDADSQLPPGVWTRAAVSTPASVYAEIVGRPRDARQRLSNSRGNSPFAKYEGKTVRA